MAEHKQHWRPLPEEPEDPGRPPSPEDFDFPVAYCWRRYWAWKYGGEDLPPLPRPPEEEQLPIYNIYMGIDAKLKMAPDPRYPQPQKRKQLPSGPTPKSQWHLLGDSLPHTKPERPQPSKRTKGFEV